MDRGRMGGQKGGRGVFDVGKRGECDEGMQREERRGC